MWTDYIWLLKLSCCVGVFVLLLILQLQLFHEAKQRLEAEMGPGAGRGGVSEAQVRAAGEAADLVRVLKGRIDTLLRNVRN